MFIMWIINKSINFKNYFIIYWSFKNDDFSLSFKLYIKNVFLYTKFLLNIFSQKNLIFKEKKIFRFSYYSQLVKKILRLFKGKKIEFFQKIFKSISIKKILKRGRKFILIKHSMNLKIKKKIMIF